MTVNVWEQARRVIRDEYSALTRFDGLETGGWLFAERAFGGATKVDVQIARGPGAGAKHGTHAYEPTADYIDVEDDFAFNGADHLCRVGDWHSHPGGGGKPSDADLHAWQNSFLRANEKRHVQIYVGLIAAPEHSNGYERMKLSGWCLSYDSLGRIIYEPAVVA